MEKDMQGKIGVLHEIKFENNNLSQIRRIKQIFKLMNFYLKRQVRSFQDDKESMGR